MELVKKAGERAGACPEDFLAVQTRDAMENCRLCPRQCGSNRSAGQTGYCHMTEEIYVARAALHYWEEPCISGTRGSGAVFFCGCNLGCIFCQNREIARGESGSGYPVSIERLSDIMLELQKQGAHNINLVTGVHYVPQICEALQKAKNKGLKIPIVYNSGGYECVETLQMLEGYVDIYLPDLKYMEPDLAASYSKAKDYPDRAKEAVAEMVRQIPKPEFDASGMMTKGVIVRNLLLPGHVKNSKAVIKYLYDTYGDRIWISLMNQYTPMPGVMDDTLLRRKVTKREYDRLVTYASELGLEQGFIQEGETAKESFIPAFNGEGVRGIGEIVEEFDCVD